MADNPNKKRVGGNLAGLRVNMGETGRGKRGKREKVGFFIGGLVLGVLPSTVLATNGNEQKHGGCWGNKKGNLGWWGSAKATECSEKRPRQKSKEGKKDSRGRREGVSKTKTNEEPLLLQEKKAGGDGGPAGQAKG